MAKSGHGHEAGIALAPAPRDHELLHQGEHAPGKIRIFEVLVLPGSWAGGADLFIGPAIWALVLSVPIVWVLRPHATKAQKLQV